MVWGIFLPPLTSGKSDRCNRVYPKRIRSLVTITYDKFNAFGSGPIEKPSRAPVQKEKEPVSQKGHQEVEVGDDAVPTMPGALIFDQARILDEAVLATLLVDHFELKEPKHSNTITLLFEESRTRL